MGQFQHPNIVKLHGVIKVGNLVGLNLLSMINPMAGKENLAAYRSSAAKFQTIF